ncbi:hypothetical protein [Anoxybacillus sp. TBDG-1]
MGRFVVIFIFLILVIIVGLFFYQGNDFKKNDSISSSDEDISSLHTVKGVIDVGKAVSESIRDHGKTYRKGEYIAAGHIILSTEQKANDRYFS